MTLNIKNEETYRLAKELAVLTGETLTATVTNSVRERLERLRHNNRDGYVERIMAIARETAPLFKTPYDTIEHGDLLYGEDGLPK